MAKKYLTDDGIANALYGLLSDYEENTDEEDEETALETALDYYYKWGLIGVLSNY